MSKKLIWGIIAIILIAIIIWVTGNKSATAPTASTKPVKIGAITVLSGPLADYGEEMRKGILAVTSSTPSVSVVFEDDKCDPKEAVSAFKKLVDFQKINVIVGPGCGSPQEAVVPLSRESHTILLVPSAASRDLYSKSGGNFFNVQYSLEDESTYIAKVMNDRGYKKVALVSYSNAFSATHVKAFKAAFKGEIIEHTFIADNADVSGEVAKIKTEKPDAIYAPDISFFFGNGVVKLNQYKVTAPVFGTYVVELPIVRKLVPNVIYSYPGDLGGTQGAVQELSKQAAVLAIDVAEKCNGVAQCMKEKLVSSGKFDSYGVYKRSLILKQVKGDQVVEVK